MKRLLRNSYLFFSAFILCTFLLFLPGIVYSQSVFINELHYDDNSTDANEGIEIAGASGTDLTGWSVVFYNGNGGVAYMTLALSGTIPDQLNGYGTIGVPETQHTKRTFGRAGTGRRIRQCHSVSQL